MGDPIAVIEAAVRDHHVLEIDYRPLGAGSVETIEAEPDAIRTSTAGHHVLWIWNVGKHHQEQLRLDQVVAARDTGRVFTPRRE